MIGTAIFVQAVELIGWTGLWLKLKGDATRQILVHGRVQPQRIPIVDTQLKDLAGHPTKFQRAASKRVIKLARRIVNTRAFEHLIAGMFNPSSKLRLYLNRPQIVRIP